MESVCSTTSAPAFPEFATVDAVVAKELVAAWWKPALGFRTDSKVKIFVRGW